VLDYILQGRAAHSKPPTPDKYIDAISLFERALALDPRSVEAQSRLAIELTARVLDQMSTSTAADIARAEELVGQALTTAPRSPLAHFAKGQVLRAQRRYADRHSALAAGTALHAPNASFESTSPTGARSGGEPS
jgi:tetratricopeptide (TPR) repeat protein